MTALAPTLQTFFTDRLIRQRQASPNTIAAYRDAWKLLIGFASDRTRKQPSQLDIADLDAELIAEFLDHLEHERGNAVTTRNARLAAIRSLFRFAALRHPEHAATIQQVLAIPPKRCDRTLITYLTDPEIDALLAAPDAATWTGRRDHALLTLAIQTGLRISELIGLRPADLQLGTGPHVACWGKGRKQRITPLTRHTIAVLRAWLSERAGGPDDPLFPTSAASDSAATRSKDDSPSTPPMPASPARPSKTRTSPPTSCGTPRRCDSSTPESTPPSSRSGSDTKTSKPPKSTSTPTSPSKNKLSPAPHRRAACPAATDPPTPPSPSSTPCDYADPQQPTTVPSQRNRHPDRHNPKVGVMGVMPMSA